MEFTASFALIFIFLVIGGGITPTVGNGENGDPRVSCDDNNCEIEITFSDADDLQRQLEEIMPCTPDQPETSSTQTVTQPTSPNVESTGLMTSAVATVPLTSTIVTAGVTQPTNPSVKPTDLITTTAANVPPTSTTVTSCTLSDCATSPNGYQYKVLPKKFTWANAIAACKEENATLPSQAYRPVVHGILITLLKKQDGPNAEFWLPLSDKDTEKVWKWHGDGSLLKESQQFWGNGQPDDDGNQDCACLRGIWWDDVTCTKPRGVVCERKL